MEARTAKALPAELLDRIASMLAIDLGTTGYATEQSEASKALCNLALTSRSLRDISQPYLFSMLSICVADMPDDDSWTVQNANEAIAIFETNPRLLDYIRHFVLLFRTSCHLVDPDYIRGDVETCQKLLGFFLPKLQKLKYLRTESRDVFRAGELAGWGIWGEATRTAFSSCIARNPLETLVVRSWAGRLCFLDHVPPSVVTLRIGDLCTPYFRKSTGLVDDSPFLSLKPSVKPTTFQLEDFVAVPHFVTQDRLSRLHTLELKNQYHNTLKILLRLAPPSLQCLRLHYRIRGFRRGNAFQPPHRDYMQIDPEIRFVPAPELQELEISLISDAYISDPPAVDSLAEFTMDHLTTAFASVRRLSIRAAFKWQRLTRPGSTEERGSNLFLGKTGEWKKLDQHLSGATCPLGNLKDVEFEVKLMAKDVDDLRASRMLEQAKDDIIATLEDTRSKFNCNVVVSQETIDDD